MKATQKLVVGTVLVLAFLGAGGLVYYLHFYRIKAQLESELSSSEAALDGYREWLESRPPAEERLRRLAAEWTLGFNGEVVDSRFRSGLSRMAESAGLVKDKIVVTPKPSMAIVKNPTVESRTAVSEFRRYMNQEYMAAPDIYLKEAQLRGSGTFEAVTRLLALAQSQPWIWSVRGFTLRPQNNEATMFDITIDLATALLPDLAPATSQGPGGTPPVEAPQIIDPTAEGVSTIASIVRRNVFAPPPPPEPEIVVSEASTSVNPPSDPPRGAESKPPPPYHEWRLTGVSGSPTQGTLAWMLNVRTGSAVLLRPGERILDAELVSAEAGEVVFVIGEQQYALALNETLADRHKLD